MLPEGFWMSLSSKDKSATNYDHLRVAFRNLDGGPDAQLADFTGRVCEALHAWEDCLRHLR